MALDGFPYQHNTVTGATGIAAASSVTVPGILTNDILFALIRYKAGEAPAAVATATFVVADGTITSASVDTSTYKLYVIWGRGN